MFAEELGGNASRRRAEENKARRKRLKEKQQQQKNKASNNVTAANATTATATANTTNTTSASNVVSPIQQTITTAKTTSTVVSTTTNSNNTKLSVLERAAEQRQIRAELNVQKQSCVVIQKHIRGWLKRIGIYNTYMNELENKLSDLKTLKGILEKKLNKTYIPPITTVCKLIQQHLFIEYELINKLNKKNKDIQQKHKQRSKLILNQLVELTILPSLEEKYNNNNNETKNDTNNNYNNNVLITWNNNIKDYTTCRRLRLFIQLLLQNVLKEQIVQKCMRILLSNNNNDNNNNSDFIALQNQCRRWMLPSNNNHNNNLDLITTLRNELLFNMTSSKLPIPLDAQDRRDACYTDTEKERTGTFVQLVLDLIIDYNNTQQQQQNLLYTRIVCEILTIPLLLWRISSKTITYFISPKTKPLLITLLDAFLQQIHSNDNYEMNNIDSLLELDDLPMTLCPATGAQRLLANLLQFGRLIPFCNGTIKPVRLEYDMATIFFDTVTILIRNVPIATFNTTRESAIAWIEQSNGNQKPIVLAPIILEQCKALLVDNYIRRICISAINIDILNTEKILREKNDKDIKHENKLQQEGQIQNATSLAAKDAKVDNNKIIGFWKSSKWAKKITKGVSNLLVSDNNNPKKDSTKQSAEKKNNKEQKLINTSSISRQLAAGEESICTDNTTITDDRTSTTTSTAEESIRQLQLKEAYTDNLLFSIMRLFSIIIARWGGGGQDDITTSHHYRKQQQRGSVSSSSSSPNAADATSVQEACVKSLLNVLCFSTPIIKVIWGIIQSDDRIVSEVYKIIDEDKAKIPARKLDIMPRYMNNSNFSNNKRISSILRNNNYDCSDGTAALLLFLSAFSHALIITDDTEIHNLDRPLPIHQIRRCIQVLKKFLYRVTCVEITNDNDDEKLTTLKDKKSNRSTCIGLALISASSRTMKDLYDRSSRRPICVPNFWTVQGLLDKEISRCKTHEDYQNLVNTSPVLHVCPYMVSFKRRLKLFERIITTSRVEIQGENSSNPFHTNPLKPGIPVRITRGRLLEDGLATMNNLGKNMRQRIAVHYYNEAGVRESGVDAGGLFKEFWVDLCAQAFDISYALFRVTESGGPNSDVGNCLYPNPSSGAAHGSDHIILFSFLGRILGKSLYEGITTQSQFAHFFLSFLKGDYNFLHMLPDLSTVDPQLYNNLMFLKTYDGDATDLCLTFTVTVDDFGGTKEVNLIPNGANIDVTNENKHLYIGLVAKYYVYDRIKEQSEAMVRGLYEVVDRSWLRMFNEPELQILISGSSDGKLDVEDLRAHCQYAGGYTGIDVNVRRFWNVVGAFDKKQQAELLRFVTSCERPPPLGFGSLNPPFTIQRVGIMRDGDKLPTASTCFNILKLPTYSSEKVLRERLLYAIQSGAGFELT